ncbi:MAG: putative metal-binding protein [Proteobacteria bacterium]|nr:putative metal-binding protein [Pseudomonadota bacterium]
MVTRAKTLGLAVDLGTTNLSLAACDLMAGTCIGTATVANPQARFGAEIISRLLAASESSATAADLQQLALKVIADALGNLSADMGLTPQDIVRVAIVGNTAMLALLVGRDCRLLLDPSLWMSFIACEPESVEPWKKDWHLLADAAIRVLQPLGGFVGSDLLAGMLNTRMDVPHRPSLLIDFGTNSEIALWDGCAFRVTSAAGGPAFEGVGIGCGMPALPGAVCNVRVDAQGVWHYDVIDGEEAKGICGSGLVDMLALIRRERRLSEGGRMENAAGGNIGLPGSPFSISRKDVDLLQRAKAAIGAGCEVLCREAGLKADELQAVYVGGAFGGYLDPANAIAVGLLPPVAANKVKICGNTALAGCQDFLLSAEAEGLMTELRSQTTVINLATRESFEECFFKHLYLRPMAAWEIGQQ